jgi:PAS domain S-box-containing protein
VHNELSRVVDALPGLVWTALPDGRMDFLNQRWCEYTGLSVDKACGRGWQSAIHPDDLPELFERWQSILASGKPGEMEARLRRFDGEYRWFLFRACPLADASGQIVKWCGMNSDIEDRRRSEEAQKRAEALLAGEKRFLEMVAGGHSMSEVLESLCQLVESTVSGCRCSVVLLDPSGRCIEHGASPGLPASFIRSIIRSAAMACALRNDAIAQGPESAFGHHTYTHRVSDVSSALGACWSTPISSAAGKVLGAFATYYKEPGTPTLEVQALMEQFSHIASIAIERAQSDAALKRSEAPVQAIQRYGSAWSGQFRASSELSGPPRYCTLGDTDEISERTSPCSEIITHVERHTDRVRCARRQLF